MEADPYEFATNLVYIVTSRTARLHKETLSQKITIKKQFFWKSPRRLFGSPTFDI